jgi:hypothetical protein
MLHYLEACREIDRYLDACIFGVLPYHLKVQLDLGTY